MARELDPDYHKKYKKRYRAIPENYQRESELHKIWYLKNKEQRKQYLLDNKEKIKIKHREYLQRKREKDINYKLGEILRSRLYKVIKGQIKSGSAVRDLGCSIPELKEYLEKQFKPEMNWDNYGNWHIDHRVPVSKFDLTDKQQFLEACHYTNLQPLWGEDNIIKSNK